MPQGGGGGMPNGQMAGGAPASGGIIPQGMASGIPADQLAQINAEQHQLDWMGPSAGTTATGMAQQYGPNWAQTQAPSWQDGMADFWRAGRAEAAASAPVASAPALASLPSNLSSLLGQYAPQMQGGSPAAITPPGASGGVPNWASYFSGLAQQPGMAAFAQAASTPSGGSLFQAPQVSVPNFAAWQPTQQGAVPASGQQQSPIPSLGQMLDQINAKKAADAAAAAQAAEDAKAKQQLQQIGFQPSAAGPDVAQGG